MNWFIIALITPIAHAAVNHIDKHLLSKYFKGGEVGALVLFSALFAIVGMPVAWLVDPNVLVFSARDISLLMINGLLLVVGFICYFYALNEDEASIVAPLFQVIPVLSFILGYVVLGETLSGTQALGGLIVILGAVFLSLELRGGVRLKQKVFWLMMASSLMYAVNGVLFKFVTEDLQRFWPALFWDFSGKVVFGVIIFLTIASYRKQFLAVLRENKAVVLGLNGLNEILGIIGEGALVFAILLAPVALVQVVSGFQPAFVFLFGVLLTLFFPGFVRESFSKWHLVQKIVGIVIIIEGTIFLSL